MERKNRSIPKEVARLGIAGAVLLVGVVGCERLVERLRPTNTSLISDLRAPIPSEIRTFNLVEQGKRETSICFGHPVRSEYPGGFGSCGDNVFTALTHFLVDEAYFDYRAIVGPGSINNNISTNSQTGSNKVDGNTFHRN